jgi:hypothetical protein
MKKTLFLLIFSTALLAFLFMGGCYYDNVATLHPKLNSGGCDTSHAMSFSADITPIFSGYCYSCHSSSQQQGGVTLDTYAGVSVVANPHSNSCQLVEALGTNPPPHIFHMPLTGSLDACSIRKIILWVNQGAANN